MIYTSLCFSLESYLSSCLDFLSYLLTRIKPHRYYQQSFFRQVTHYLLSRSFLVSCIFFLSVRCESRSLVLIKCLPTNAKSKTAKMAIAMAPYGNNISSIEPTRKWFIPIMANADTHTDMTMQQNTLKLSADFMALNVTTISMMKIGTITIILKSFITTHPFLDVCVGANNVLTGSGNQDPEQFQHNKSDDDTSFFR